MNEIGERRVLKKSIVKRRQIVFSLLFRVLYDFSFATSVSPASRAENGFGNRWVFCLCIFVCGTYIFASECGESCPLVMLQSGASGHR